MNKLLTTILFLGCSLFLQAQEEKVPWIHTIEVSGELGLGGALYGIQVKVNKRWKETKRYELSSSIGLSTYWGKPNSYTSFNPYLVERSNISGFATDNHLRLYSGGKLFLFKNKRFNISSEFYVGAFHAYQRGRYQHERLDVDQSFSAGQLFADYGTRGGFGARVYKSLTVNLTITLSLRQLGYGYKLIPTVYQYETDNKQSLGISFLWDL